jgi:aryl-alcohol dehydrogenase-like predicted oxidoreductase
MSEPCAYSPRIAPITRRDVLRAAAAAACAAPVAGADNAPAPPPTTQPAEPLPRHTLGRTGVQVTRLALGAGYPSYERRLLEYAFHRGIRYFDNAYGYGNGAQEAILGRWITATGRRDDVFVVTKDGLADTGQFYDKALRRLDALGIDTLDMLFIHDLTVPAVALDRSGEWKALKDRLVREKKIRFMGFSTHADFPARVHVLRNAAKSKWVDALMVACDPLLIRTNDDFNRALDECAKANVGLVAMKTTRALGAAAAKRRGVPEGSAETETMPPFDQQGLSAFAAVHRGMWSDGRFAAICSAMLNFKRIDENTQNLRHFVHDKPFGPAEMKQLEDGLRQLAMHTCPGCDGSCRRAAGTETDFAAIARYVAYADHDGNRAAARRWFANLPPEARDWSGADLAAASNACKAKLDLAAIIDRAARLLT